MVQAWRVAAPRVHPPAIASLRDVLDRPETVAAWSVRLFLPLAALAIQLSSAALLPLVALAGFTGFVVLRRAPAVQLTVPFSLVALAIFAFADWTIGGYRRSIVVGCCGLWIVAATAASGIKPLALVRALVDSAGIYLAASVLLHYLGYPHGSFRISLPTSSIGGGARVLFPLDSGITTPPAVAAVYLAGLAADLRRPRRRAVLAATVGAAVCALYVLVEGNGRAALVVTILAVYLALLAPTFLARANAVLVPVLVALPFWWLAIQSRVADPIDRIGTMIPGLNRSALPLATFEGRTYAWRAIYNHISGIPIAHLLFGWGADGELGSHISRFYAQYFLYTTEPAAAPAQSTVLQQLLDAGVIGTIALLLVATFTAWLLGQGRFLPDPADRRATAVGTAILFVLAATASVDGTLAPATPRGPFWIFAILSGYFLLSRQRRIRWRGRRETA